jgi:hypothetical protein
MCKRERCWAVWPLSQSPCTPRSLIVMEGWGGFGEGVRFGEGDREDGHGWSVRVVTGQCQC